MNTDTPQVNPIRLYPQAGSTLQLTINPSPGPVTLILHFECTDTIDSWRRNIPGASDVSEIVPDSEPECIEQQEIEEELARCTGNKCKASGQPGPIIAAKSQEQQISELLENQMSGHSEESEYQYPEPVQEFLEMV
ncbi:hypothetical protein GYMLUDRAFT_65309 [Collybiopsis luxurians FD-317 M1]|uniref:Uncharacterized protein n=1 Tax=Collybiopsis luxurians FD-317 M1 TaxID=944289 RepID=A0A0D0C6L8_9AGAR|nr:hypothetical protein GYMLUDRAFT_65309 [Collybiopsis luxurians FD-317 M1]